MVKLTKHKDHDRLKKFSHHCLTDGYAFTDLDFGSGNKFGINGSCPADTLHCNQKGLMSYAKETFFDQRKQASLQRKKGVQKKTTTMTKPMSAEDLAEDKVFSPSHCRVVEELWLQWGALLQQQSDRDPPRTHFPQGISDQTKTQGHEQRGTILLILLLLCSGFVMFSFFFFRLN